MEIKIKKLHPEAKIPVFARDGDAGMDLYSLEEYELKPGERKLFKTGLAMELPVGYASFIWGRSGHALKQGIAVLGGLIDSGYRGDYGIILLNTGDDAYVVQKGERIAQVAIQPVVKPVVIEVDELSTGERNDGAFGSSGKF